MNVSSSSSFSFFFFLRMDLDTQLMNHEFSFTSLILDDSYPIQQRLRPESVVGGLHKTSSFSSSSSLSSPSQSLNDLLVQNFPQVDDHNHQTPINGVLGYSNNPNSFSTEGFSFSSTSSQNKLNSYVPVFPTQFPSSDMNPVRDLASGFSTSTNNYQFHDHHRGKFIQTHNNKFNQNDGPSQQNNLAFPNPSLKRIDEDEVGKDGPSLSAKSTKRSVVKGQWTAEEDNMLVRLVGKHGLKRWSIIASIIGGRIGKQCRERWHNQLKPCIKKDAWSEEEDVILIQAHKKMGNKWAKIAELLPGRTENNIKNHWNAAKRRQPISTRRNYRSAEPSASAAGLKEYIHAVTSPSSPSLTETIQIPAPSNWVTNSNFVIGSSSEAATGPPATGAMYDLHEASEQPFHFDADSDWGFEGGGFGSDVEIPELSFSDFSNTNLFGMSIDSYNGEVDGPAMGMAGNGGED